MKKLRIVALIAVLAIAAGALAACNFDFDKYLHDEETPDYNFSEGAASEIELFFTAINNEKPNGTFVFKIKSTTYTDTGEVEGGEEGEVTSQMLSEGGKDYRKHTVVKGGKNLSMVITDDGTAYLDNDLKTYASESYSAFSNFEHAVEAAWNWAKVQLENAGGTALWTFVEKTKLKINDKTGREIDAFEFLYNSAPDGTKMRVYFLRTFISMEKLVYEYYSDGIMTSKVEMFISFGATPAASDFSLTPEGYTAH
jgi:hypothetical protein